MSTSVGRFERPFTMPGNPQQVGAEPDTTVRKLQSVGVEIRPDNSIVASAADGRKWFVTGVRFKDKLVIRRQLAKDASTTFSFRGSAQDEQIDGMQVFNGNLVKRAYRQD